jgi:hypothetical protein
MSQGAVASFAEGALTSWLPRYLNSVLTASREHRLGGENIVEHYDQAVKDYEQRVQRARSLFQDSTIVKTLRTTDDEVLELFLINFCAFGVGMTEPVEGWVRRAGERCETIGLADLGRALKMHAKHEADDHLMMIEDTKSLTALWNERREGERLNAEELLARPIPAGVAQYQKLHEDIIASSAPYKQIAVEYEIEWLSVNYGPELMGRCGQKLGREVIAGLSFVRDHVAVDVELTTFNRRELGKFLAAHPDYLDGLVEGGTQAIGAYQKYLEDCLLAALDLKKTHV